MNEKQLKILQLGKFYPILGGVEKVAYDLMVGLSERNIDCDMLCAALEGAGVRSPSTTMPGSSVAGHG